MATLQACASVGQTALTEAYAEVLRERGVLCGQVLLTRRDVVDRDAYLNARNTLTRLLELGAVPVVNENDTVSVAEFTFGDNDMLGAIVSALVGADLYIILSDVDGLYTANPSVDPTATLPRGHAGGPLHLGRGGGLLLVLWHGRHVLQGARRPWHDGGRHPHGHLRGQATARPFGRR